MFFKMVKTLQQPSVDTCRAVGWDRWVDAWSHRMVREAMPHMWWMW